MEDLNWDPLTKIMEFCKGEHFPVAYVSKEWNKAYARIVKNTETTVLYTMKQVDYAIDHECLTEDRQIPYLLSAGGNLRDLMRYNDTCDEDEYPFAAVGQCMNARILKYALENYSGLTFELSHNTYQSILLQATVDGRKSIVRRIVQWCHERQVPLGSEVSYWDYSTWYHERRGRLWRGPFSKARQVLIDEMARYPEYFLNLYAQVDTDNDLTCLTLCLRDTNYTARDYAEISKAYSHRFFASAHLYLRVLCSKEGADLDFLLRQTLMEESSFFAREIIRAGADWRPMLEESLAGAGSDDFIYIVYPFFTRQDVEYVLSLEYGDETAKTAVRLLSILEPPAH